LDEDRQSRGRIARGTDEMGSDADSNAEGPGTRDPSSAPAASLRVVNSSNGERAASVAPGSSESYHPDDDYSAVVSGYEADVPSPRPQVTTPRINLSTQASNITVASAVLPRRNRSVSLSDLFSSSPLPSTSRSPVAHNINLHNINTLKGKNRYQNVLGQQSLLAGSIAIPKERLLLPGNGKHPVQWRGCGAYFCLNGRPMGDNRGRCTSNGKECHECSVFVCEVSSHESSNQTNKIGLPTATKNMPLQLLSTEISLRILSYQAISASSLPERGRQTA
jgi:hypothetical protein